MVIIAAETDNTARNKELVEAIATLLWDERYEEIEAYLADGNVGHDPMVPEGTRDAADMEEHFGPMRAAMSDIDYRILDMATEGDLVFNSGRLSATHTGEFMGFPATDEPIVVVVEDHIGWRLEDGELAESWAQYDAIAMMRQMGMEMSGPT